KAGVEVEIAQTVSVSMGAVDDNEADLAVADVITHEWKRLFGSHFEMPEPTVQPKRGDTRRNSGRIVPIVSAAPARMAVARVGGINEQHLAAAIVLQCSRGAEGSKTRARTDCHD